MRGGEEVSVSHDSMSSISPSDPSFTWLRVGCQFTEPFTEPSRWSGFRVGALDP